MRYRDIGVTGTRKGGTERQLGIAREVLKRGAKSLEFHYLHHGDCEGADAQIDAIAKELGYRTICHPPVDPRHRANTRDHKLVHPVKPYIQRNRAIVEAVEVLLALPGEHVEVLRSGTWATVRWARRVQTTCMIVFPSGAIRVEDNHGRAS